MHTFPCIYIYTNIHVYMIHTLPSQLRRNNNASLRGANPLMAMPVKKKVLIKNGDANKKMNF